jgi:hypothetical protein
MVINTLLEETQATVGAVPAFPAFVGPDDNVLAASSKVSALAATPAGAGALTAYTKYTHEWVDASGAVLAVAAPIRNFVRYAEFPGQRLFKKVKFEVNGNPLTVSYTMSYRHKYTTSRG